MFYVCTLSGSGSFTWPTFQLFLAHRNANQFLLGGAPAPYPAGVAPAQAVTGSTPTEEGASKDPAAALKAGMEAGDCPGGDPGRDGEPPDSHPPENLHTDGNLTLCRKCTYFFAVKKT